jgi:hypothetical protein
MTKCNKEIILFPVQKGRRIEASFTGGDISSDGGLPLIRQVDQRIGLTRAVAASIDDPRDPLRIQHPLAALIQQRVYAIAQGYEDLNDHQQLRHDILFQTAVNSDEALGSSPTLCRMENWGHHRQSAVSIHRVIIDKFMASYASPPQELILDFDATDTPIHGQQQDRFFHGYYDHYCFLPLFVFCGRQLLVSYLRPSKIDGAKHAWAILSLLVKHLRQAWPKVRIIFRGDSGFCRHKMLNWCDRHQVGYCVGLAKNQRLNHQPGVAEAMWEMSIDYHMTGVKQRQFESFDYAAQTWSRQRRVIARLEYGSQGDDHRYIVTNIAGPAKAVYEKLYCKRGEMENRIKSIQMDLFSGRSSCHYFIANQFRLLMSSLAYVLLERFQAMALTETELADSSLGTARLRLLKIGAVIIRNTRRIKIMLSSACPYQELFRLAVRRLSSAL